MKIALIGASGMVGSRLLDEALRRGHSVTAIVRNPEKIAPREGVRTVKGDVADTAAMAALLRGHDVLISATRFLGNDPAKPIAAAKQAGVRRLLVVGGAGSLEAAPGIKLVDMPHFPEAYKPEAQAGSDWLDAFRRETALDWSFLSPAASFAPGQRTGTFRLGKDTLLTAADGKSHISVEDYAIALLDEVEQPKHNRSRFTVGY